MRRQDRRTLNALRRRRADRLVLKALSSILILRVLVLQEPPITSEGGHQDTEQFQTCYERFTALDFKFCKFVPEQYLLLNSVQTLGRLPCLLLPPTSDPWRRRHHRRHLPHPQGGKSPHPQGGKTLSLSEGHLVVSFIKGQTYPFPAISIIAPNIRLVLISTRACALSYICQTLDENIFPAMNGIKCCLKPRLVRCIILLVKLAFPSYFYHWHYAFSFKGWPFYHSWPSCTT